MFIPFELQVAKGNQNLDWRRSRLSSLEQVLTKQTNSEPMVESKFPTKVQG